MSVKSYNRSFMLNGVNISCYSKEEFKDLVAQISSLPGFTTPQAWTIYTRDLDLNGNIICCYYHNANLEENYGAFTVLSYIKENVDDLNDFMYFTIKFLLYFFKKMGGRCKTQKDDCDGSSETIYVDKIPYLLDHIIPKGVRIANKSSVRFGAYLSLEQLLCMLMVTISMLRLYGLLW